MSSCIIAAKIKPQGDKTCRLGIYLKDRC